MSLKSESPMCPALPPKPRAFPAVHHTTVIPVPTRHSRLHPSFPRRREPKPLSAVANDSPREAAGVAEWKRPVYTSWPVSPSPFSGGLDSRESGNDGTWRNFAIGRILQSSCEENVQSGLTSYRGLCIYYAIRLEVRLLRNMKWTPLVGQDQAPIKWDSCAPS